MGRNVHLYKASCLYDLKFAQFWKNIFGLLDENKK